VYRRRLLGLLGVCGVAAGSGCSGLLESGRPSYLDGVTVRNEDGVAREFELTVERDGSVAHESTIELDGSEFRGGDQHKPLSSVDCEWFGRGPFVVTCTLGNGQTEAARVLRRHIRGVHQASRPRAPPALDARAASHHTTPASFRPRTHPAQRT